MNSVAIVGAGASGLFLAGLLSEKGWKVCVFDGNEKVGKKLYITGKGRCNLTNLCDADEFLGNVLRGEKFLRSAIHNFNSFDAVAFFENLGLRTKVERGNRVFPMSDKSSDVIKVLQKSHCKNVEFHLECKVLKVKKVGDSFEVCTKNGNFNFDRVVIATGGKSYCATGSTGDGFKFARDFGHLVVPLVPALCPIKLKDDFVRKLQGVSLKNVSLKVIADGKKQEYFGEMMFTDEGITGPIVLTASSHINRCEKIELFLDFKPALSREQLDLRLLREFDAAKNKNLRGVLETLLPKSVASVFAECLNLNTEQKNNSITKAERLKIVDGLKNFPLCYGGLYDLDAGIVTSGGVERSQVDPKTFESKLVKGLYFVGEVLDVDALTGGFNLQIAWATAYSCAKNW